MTTVVIPTIGRPTLIAALRCARSQTVPVQVTVVDDSPGRSRTEVIRHWVAEELAGVDAKVVSTGGVGLAGARNIGIGDSSGPLISLLDDDDVVCPHHVERLMDAIGEQRDGVFAWNAAQVVHIDGPDSVRLTDSVYGWRGASSKLGMVNVIPPSCALFGKDIAPVFDESLPALEDWDAWLQMVYDKEVPVRYSGVRTVGYVKDVSRADSMSVRATRERDKIQPVIDAYWTICGRYPARERAAEELRDRFGGHQRSWCETFERGETLSFDYYEQILRGEFGPATPEPCCDFDLGAAALPPADGR
jgi:glycosyltransferase involved in cell wall biosynthesis